MVESRFVIRVCKLNGQEGAYTSYRKIRVPEVRVMENQSDFKYLREIGWNRLFSGSTVFKPRNLNTGVSKSSGGVNCKALFAKVDNFVNSS